MDGIVFDAAGNPTKYHVLRQHPGDGRSLSKEYDRVPAEAVLHLFRADRRGQHRGIPEITPALPLFAMLRDYSLATLDAAKAAAYYAGIIYTDAPPNGETDPVEALDPIELDRNMLLTMPGGWKMAQLHAEQPTGTYAEFKREVLNEIARCLNMPFKFGHTRGFGFALSEVPSGLAEVSKILYQMGLRSIRPKRTGPAEFPDSSMGRASGC